MWAVYAGILKPDVKDHLDEYYDRPFDVFVSYYDTGIYRLPEEWAKAHGPSKQMDWGSWLYVCSKYGLWDLLEPEKKVVQVLPANEEREEPVRLPAMEARELPDEEWYGILEVECY